MLKLPFPPPYRHEHGPVKNANEVVKEQLTLGQRASDWIAEKVGSWEFIIGQSALLILWAILNVTAWVQHWDPYPFILMNLVLSLQAAYTAPMIMMSQNRKADRDRIEAHIDYEINLKAETEIKVILENLEAQNAVITELHQMLEELRNNKNDRYPCFKSEQQLRSNSTPNGKMSTKRPPTSGLRIVAIFEGAKGALVLLAGFGLLSLIHKDLHVAAVRLVDLLHFNPARHYASNIAKVMTSDRILNPGRWFYDGRIQVRSATASGGLV